jgi:hypothetical protein
LARRGERPLAVRGARNVALDRASFGKVEDDDLEALSRKGVRDATPDAARAAADDRYRLQWSLTLRENRSPAG